MPKSETKDIRAKGEDNPSFQSDEKEKVTSKDGPKGKSKGTSENVVNDPSMLTLFQKAAARSAEIKSKEMVEGSRRRQNESDHVPMSPSRDKLIRSADDREKRREKRTRSPKTDKILSEKEKVKRMNGVAQMSGDRLPPAYNTQRVVYFQNRFIVVDSSDRHISQTQSPISKQTNDVDNSYLNKGKMDSMETSFSKINNMTDTKNKRKDNEIDSSNITMDPHAIDIILTDPDNSSKQIKNMDSFNTDESNKKNTIWRKINRFLLDDRVKASNGQIVLENRHPEEYRILKKVLNILFLTIGITLFVSVIIVVIYAFIVGDEKDNSFLKTTAAPPAPTSSSNG